MTTSGGKLISQMKLVSVLNMSPGGMRLHFQSLILRELKLIFWTCRRAEAAAAGRRLSTPTSSENLPLFPFDSGITSDYRFEPDNLRDSRAISIFFSSW